MENDYDVIGRTHGHYGGKIDCYSALGLLGLLGLLEILRDLISNITEEGGTRKKRSLHFIPRFDSFGLPSDMISILKNSISDDILENFPAILLPMMHVVADVNDDLLDSSCLETSFCESNLALVYPHKRFTSISSEKTGHHPKDYSNDDIFGIKTNTRLKIAQFLSETIAKAFIDIIPEDGRRVNQSFPLIPESNLLLRALAAAEDGRNGANCKELYSECSLTNQYKPIMKLQGFFDSFKASMFFI